MTSPAQLVLPYAMPAMLAWIYYKRVRRNFGPQAWQPGRLWFRIALLSVAAIGLLAAATFLPHVAMAVAGGMAAGAALGALGLRHTHAEWRDGVRTYIPNPWIGGLLTLVLAARLAWRYTHGGGMQAGAMQGGAGAQAMQQPSALTLGIAAVLVGYSLCYGIGLVVRMRALGAHPPQ
jgi:hypothetical protein